MTILSMKYIKIKTFESASKKLWKDDEKQKVFLIFQKLWVVEVFPFVF